jgi:release factor glutamine methyltransferase
LLLAFVLCVDRMTLYVDHARPLIASELNQYRELIRQRGQRVPLQLLTGSVQLHALEFAVRRGVFIPRPETETLVRAVLELMPAGPKSFAEVGIGSGCIAVSLLHAWRQARAVAWDLSRESIELSAENAARHGVGDRLQLELADGVQALRAQPGAFELVVSNPPYVGERERAQLEPELRYDPELALFSGADGLQVSAQLIPAAGTALRASGWLAVEHGASQGLAVRQHFAAAGFQAVCTSLDLAGRERVTIGRR